MGATNSLPVSSASPHVEVEHHGSEVGASPLPPASDPSVPEQWRPVVGYEGLYSVSDQGRVFSHRAARVLSAAATPKGYLDVSLWRDGKGSTKRVHHLVAYAFLGPRPEGLELRHLNDIKTDNTPANLRYGTASDNAMDQVRNGGHHCARRTHCFAGHEYTAENTRIDRARGDRLRRVCRSCESARGARNKGRNART